MDSVEINASGQVLGRLASRIALLLMGKQLPSYRPDREAEVTVVVKNAAKIVVTGKKLEQKFHYRFSGYPGGLKKKQLRDSMAEHPDQVLRTAVRRMLPANRLRPRLLKRLIIDTQES